MLHARTQKVNRESSITSVPVLRKNFGISSAPEPRKAAPQSKTIIDTSVSQALNAKIQDHVKVNQCVQTRKSIHRNSNATAKPLSIA